MDEPARSARGVSERLRERRVIAVDKPLRVGNPAGHHWLSSPRREEVFGPLGITLRTFKDPQGSKRVGMIVEIPDFAAFQQFMQTEPPAEAMKNDGIHPDTLVILAEG